MVLGNMSFTRKAVHDKSTPRELATTNLHRRDKLRKAKKSLSLHISDCPHLITQRITLVLSVKSAHLI